MYTDFILKEMLTWHSWNSTVINTLTTGLKRCLVLRQMRNAFFVKLCLCTLTAIQTRYSLLMVQMMCVLMLCNFPVFCWTKCNFWWSNRRVVDMSFLQLPCVAGYGCCSRGFCSGGTNRCKQACTSLNLTLSRKKSCFWQVCNKIDWKN